MKFRALLFGLLLACSQTGHAQMKGMAYYGMSTCDMNYGMDYGMMMCNMLNVSASAGGQVMSSPSGIACPGTCTNSYPMGTITLTAVPSAGFTFKGWDGDCAGSGATCTVSMDDARAVIANFAAAAAPAIVPETGFWYNPAEGGRGYVIEVHSNGNLFIGGFMYDANGNAIWYASGPGAMSGSTYTGQWQQYANGESLTGSYKPSTVSNPQVGSIALQFLTTTTATLTLPDGRQISLARFPF